VDTLDPDGRAALDAAGTVRRVRSGTVVLLEGERSDRLVVIRTGLLKVTSVLPDGNEAVLAFRGAGELVGELATMDGGTRSASAVAVIESEVRLVSASEFRRLLASHPSLALALIDVLVARLRESDRHRVHFASDGVPRRLARALLDLASRNGTVHEDGSVAIDLAITQDDLAGIVAASRDSIARTLRTWRNQGMVETGRRRILIRDPAGLSRQQLP
jgi:CRP-like cAMP-binding protein